MVTPPPRDLSLPAGKMSSYIWSLKEGDSGQFLVLLVSSLRKKPKLNGLLGGGAGMAPMRSHIFDQLKRLKTNGSFFWYGFWL